MSGSLDFDAKLKINNVTTSLKEIHIPVCERCRVNRYESM